MIHSFRSGLIRKPFLTIIFLLVVSLSVLYTFLITHIPQRPVSEDNASPLQPLQNPSFDQNDQIQEKINKLDENVLHLAVVVCGQRHEEALVMVKSALIFSTLPIFLHVFADSDLGNSLEAELQRLKRLTSTSNLLYQLYPIQFPDGHDKQWRKLFKPCACQRLFIPSILKNVDSLIYVDTDVIFLHDPVKLWQLFTQFTPKQIAGLAPETEDSTTNWYVRFGRHPYFEPLGVNSGVMLMNLTRMRNFNWEALLWPTYKKYRDNLTWGDQDIINIIFHDHSEKLHLFGCEWNYRPDHCMYSSTCKKARMEGARIIHGSRGFLHNGKDLSFMAVFDSMKEFDFGKEPQELLKILKRKMEDAMKSKSKSECLKVPGVFYKSVETYLYHDHTPDAQ